MVDFSYRNRAYTFKFHKIVRLDIKLVSLYMEKEASNTVNILPSINSGYDIYFVVRLRSKR